MSGVTKPQFVAILINLSYRDDNAYEFQNIICLLHPYTFTGDNECWAGNENPACAQLLLFRLPKMGGGPKI